MKINIQPIPQSQQRYDTWGDWFYDEAGALQIRVSEQFGTALDPAECENHQFLIALHELIEVWLCKQRGVTQEQVDSFDFNFKGEGEPGDDPKAPYRREHRFAMLIEHLVAHELGLKDYGSVE